MSYRPAIKYLDSFINYEKKAGYSYKESLKLERIEGFLRIIGNPQERFKSIHVAGTKGKGSVCAFTAYILREAGYKVGLFTSPHLSDVRERIRILLPGTFDRRSSPEDFEGMIPRKVLAELVTRLKGRIDKYCGFSKYGPLSFFEAYTAIAFEYFKEQEVDFAVLETGLGGRLDATNVVDPVICGITPISYDHTDKLGNSLAEIAAEKAGIIKSHKTPACPAGRQDLGHWAENKGQKLIVVSAAQEDEVLKVLKDRSAEEQAQFYQIGKDIKFDLVGSDNESQAFNIRGVFGRFDNLRIKLLGAHQVANAALAASLVSGIFTRNRQNFKISDFRKGLQRTCWPARFETVSRKPLIILDGAHNPASARVLVAALKHNFPQNKVTLVLGISRDKDAQGITRELFPVAEKVILTCADNPRSLRPEDILSAGKDFLKARKAVLTKSVLEALKIVRSSASSDSLVLVTGSLFVAGEARGIIKNMPAE
jgi:dihydrofolate synthase / folylpolyglutamate synthase